MTFLLNIILAQIKWRTTTANVYIKLEMRSVPGTHIHSYKNSPLHYLIKFDDKDFKKQFFFLIFIEVVLETVHITQTVIHYRCCGRDFLFD